MGNLIQLRVEFFTLFPLLRLSFDASLLQRVRPHRVLRLPAHPCSCPSFSSWGTSGARTPPTHSAPVLLILRRLRRPSSLRASVLLSLRRVRLLSYGEVAAHIEVRRLEVRHHHLEVAPYFEVAPHLAAVPHLDSRRGTASRYDATSWCSASSPTHGAAPRVEVLLNEFEWHAGRCGWYPATK